jgi:DNA-binding transcriptional MerR regulator
LTGENRKLLVQQMSDMQTKYQDKMGELHGLHATDKNFDLAGGIGKLKDQFKAELIGAAENMSELTGENRKLLVQQMSNMQTKYQDRMGELHSLNATDKNFDLAGGIGKLKEEFKAEIMGAASAAGIDMDSRRGSNQSFRNRLFSAEEMIDLPLKIAQLKAAEYNLEQTLQDLNKLEQQISKLSANDEVSRNIKVSNYNAIENRVVGQERQIEELNQQINALREKLGIPTEAPSNTTLNTTTPGRADAWSPVADSGTAKIVSAVDSVKDAVLTVAALAKQQNRDIKAAEVGRTNAQSIG